MSKRKGLPENLQETTMREKRVLQKLLAAETSLAKAVHARINPHAAQAHQAQALSAIVEAIRIIDPPIIDGFLRYVAEFLHPEGKLRDALPEKELARVFAMGDGFGPIGDAVFEINSGWDWSHIRDSSPGAVWRMKCELEHLVEKYTGRSRAS